MITLMHLMAAATIAAPVGASGAPGAMRGPVTLPAHDDTVRIITLPEEGSPFIAFNFWVKTGSQDDPQGKEGLAALTASLIAQGSSRSRSYQDILEALYPMATGYGSSVDKEMTVFRGVVHKDNLEEFYQLLSQALLEPAFSEEDFKRVKNQTMNFLERGRRYNRDEELSKELLYWMAYQGTPYEHPEEGYVQSVKSITLDDVKDFYRTHYLANNIVVAVGGGYPEGFPQRVRADVDAALPTGTVTRVSAPQPEMPDGVKVLIVDKNTDATAISMGFPIPLVRGDNDFVAMMVVNSWFGEHRNSFSHLYQVIRERRGMNYGDYSYIEPFPLGYTTQQRPVNYARRSNLFEIWIRPVSLTSPTDLHDRALFATRAAWRELDRLVREGLPEDQVERTKKFLYNFSLTYGSTIGRRLAYAVDDAFYGLKPGYLEMIRPGLAELTKEKVDAAIRRNLQAKNMYLVFITRDAEGMKEKLLSGEPTPITYAGTPSPEIQAEDKEIAAFPIPVRAEDITILPISQVFEGRKPD
ncbi:MAG: M16 family metallopeptidase [Gemmatimonadota bacterium]